MRLFERRQGLVYPAIFNVGVIVLSCSLLISCGPDFSSNSSPTPLATPGSKKETKSLADSVKVEVLGMEPYRYQVTLHWSQELSNVSIFINKQFSFKTDSPNVTTYTVGLDHNREYNIAIYSQKTVESKPNLISEFKLNTPLDVVLSTDFLKSSTLVKNLISVQAHRVFVINKVITNGKNILLNTDEFIADSAEFSTFEESQKAAVNTPGRNGGHLFIKAQKAKGQIVFVLRGEFGGDGTNGEPYAERAKAGDNGADGRSEYWDSDRGGKSYCSKRPENGKPGTPGNNGRPGSNGRAGGDTGALHLEIAEHSTEFHFKVEKEIGIAGNFGQGGPGQIGGLGGQAGKTVYKCENAKNGHDGKTGERGPDGIREKDGNIEQDCVSIGEGFGRCS